MHIRKELSNFRRVITYDRAGMGSSDPGPLPTPEHTIKELKNLLNKTGAPGPYVLVGHSLGGLIARLYALKYPHQVAGLVFLDSTHEFLKDDAKFKQGFAIIGYAEDTKTHISIWYSTIPWYILGMISMYGHELSYYKQQLSAEEYMQWKGMVYRIFARKTAGAEFKGAWVHLDLTQIL